MFVSLAEFFTRVDNLKLPQKGKVVLNEDPKQLGRVKCTIKGLIEETDTDKLPWVHPLNPYGLGGSPDCSSFVVPMVGRELIITFPFHDIYYPFYVGYWQSELTHQKAMFEEDYPNSYGWVDPEVLWWMVNMVKQYVELYHPSQACVRIDKDGNVWINSPKNITIEAGENFLFQAGKDFQLKVGDNFLMDVGKNAELKTGQSFLVDSGSNIEQKAGSDFLAKAGSNLETTAGNNRVDNAGNTHSSKAGQNMFEKAGSIHAIEAGTIAGIKARVMISHKAPKVAHNSVPPPPARVLSPKGFSSLQALSTLIQWISDLVAKIAELVAKAQRIKDEAEEVKDEIAKL